MLVVFSKRQDQLPHLFSFEILFNETADANSYILTFPSKSISRSLSPSGTCALNSCCFSFSSKQVTCISSCRNSFVGFYTEN